MTNIPQEENSNNENTSSIPTNEIGEAKRKKLGTHRGSSNNNNTYTTMDDISTLSTSQPCTPYNYLNLFFYVLNAACVYGVGVFGVLDTMTVADMTEKYQTLLTPVSWAFSIWVLIFLSQGIFILFQLAPFYRSLPIVQNGVKYWYILICLTQIGWICSSAYNLIALSLGLITLVFLSLFGCLRSLSYNAPPPKGQDAVMGAGWEYTIFRFPFYVHAGWIFVAMLMNANTYLVFRNTGMERQLWAAIMSLSILFGVAVGVIFHRTSPDYTIPSVLAFGTATIALEVSNPSEYISATFEQHTIENIWASCVVITLLILVLILVRLVISGCQKLRGGGNDNQHDVESGRYVNMERMKKGHI